MIQATSLIDSPERNRVTVEIDAVALMVLGADVVSAESTRVVLRNRSIAQLEVTFTGTEAEMAELVKRAKLILTAYELARINDELLLNNDAAEKPA